MQVDVASLKKNPGASIDVKVEGHLPDLATENNDIVKVLSAVKADLHLTNTNQLITVEGTISVKIRLRCSRCLEVFQHLLTVPISEAFREGKGPDEESEEEGIDFFQSDTLDLTAVVRDSLLTALPMSILCREDCRGLCPRCGQNLNNEGCSCRRHETDPRLAGLGKFFHD